MWYVVKDNQDDTFTVVRKSDQRHPLKLDYHTLVEGGDFRFPVADMVDGQIEISNDQAAQDAYDAQEAQAQADRQEMDLLKDNYQQLLDDIESISSVASAKAVLRKIAKGMKYIITRM